MKTTVTPIPIPHLCIVTAADIEFNAVTEQLSESSSLEFDEIKICRGRAARNSVTVLQSQIGAHGFRQKLAAHLAQEKYDAVIVIGVAGALSPELKVGEIVFYDTCFLFRPESFAVEEGAPEALQSEASAYGDFDLSSSLRQQILANGLSVVFGAGLTLDFMVTKAAEKLAMGESYNAAAVDMESYDVIDVATQAGLPCAVLRVILDEANQTTPDFNLAIEAGGKMNNAKAGLAMLLRPFAAVRFFLSLYRAMKSLRTATKIVLQT